MLMRTPPSEDRLAEAGGLSLERDPYGYALDGKPRFLLRGLMSRMVGKTIIPDDQQRILQDLGARGTIVYALKHRSQMDFAYLALRLAQLGLPAPRFLFDVRVTFWQPWWYALRRTLHHLWRALTRAAPLDPYADGYYEAKVRAGEPGLFFLLGEEGYYRRTVLVGNEPLEHLLDIQRGMERPIFVVPAALLYTRSPGREKKGLLETFTGPREQPTFIQKVLSFAKNYPYAVLEMGEPVNLREILPELSEALPDRRKQVYKIRRDLSAATDEIKRAVVGPTLKSKLELKEIVLNNPRLEAVMQRRARASGHEIQEVRREADRHLEEIAATYSATLVQLGESVLNWVWNTIFDGIEVDMESLQAVRQAARHKTLVYVPCHKSHTDYLILSFILFKNNLSSPFIAAGKNLSFWPMGSFFRRVGAFFVRRSFRGQKFYAEVFSLYVKTLVQLGHNIEFFIEGGRSRTGKLVMPKLGLLSILLQAVQEGFCDDLVFVPTAINYDRIPEEEAYLKEVTGGSKQNESIRGLVGARHLLKKRYGRIYLRFAEPISFRGYLARHHMDVASISSRERHEMYRDFANHVIHSINDVSLVTPYSLVSSALMTTSRHGISQAELQAVCSDFHAYLTGLGVRFSKTLRDFEPMMRETLRLLEREGLVGRLKEEDEDLEDTVYTIEDAKRLTLEYYKNSVLHFFIPPAFVSTAILAQPTFHFSVSQVVSDVAFMKDFFKYDFFYDKDTPDEALVRRELDTFEGMGWVRRLNGAEDHPYALTRKGLGAAHSFHGLIRNYFEGYWLVLRAFRALQKRPYGEREFLRKVFKVGEKALKLELIERPEAVSKIMFANALKYYLEKNLTTRTTQHEGKEKDREVYTEGSDRSRVAEYSKTVSRLLRSPYLALQ